MRWRKISLWASLILVGTIVLAGVWIWTTDLGVFKPRIERWVSETTGRDFRIGELSIDLAGKITVVGKDLQFANADWAGPNPMLTAGHIEVRLDAASLFDPPLVIEAVDIRDATIQLKIPEGGDPNWQLWPADDEPEPSAEEATPDGLLVLLRDARVADIRLVYDSAERPAPIELIIDSATQQLRRDRFLDLSATGTLSGRDIAIEGQIGTWRSLLSARDIEYNLSGRFDTLTLSTAGRIDDLSRPVQPTMTFEADGPDIDDLTRMLGLGDDGSGNIAVKGELDKRGDGMELFVAGNLGENRVDVRASFLSLVDFEKIDAELRASGPDLSQPLAIAGVQGLDSAPFQLIADIERDGKVVRVSTAEMLYGDIRLLLSGYLPEFPALDDGSVDLSLQGSELARLRRLTGLPGAADGAFSATATLSMDAARRELFDVSMETILGRLTAKGEIKGGATFLGSDADLELEIYDAAAAASAWQIDIGELPSERLHVSGAIEYTDGALLITRPLSASLGELYVGAEGRIALAEGGAGSNLVVEASADRLTRVTDPFTRSRFVPPDEFAARAHVVLEPGVIRFDDLTGTLGTAAVDGSGSIHLRQRIAGSTIRFDASGDTLEAVLAYIPELDLRPGPFAVSGQLRFAEDALHIDDIDLDRSTETLDGRLSVGLPIERDWLEIVMKVSSDDVNRALRHLPGFDPAKAPFTMDLAIERNGDTLQMDRVDITLADARFSARGPLNLGDRLELSQLTLTADVPSLARLGTVNGREFQDQAFGFDGVVSGDRGQLRIENAKIRLADSDMTGFVSYTTGQTPILRMDVSSDRLIVKPLFVRDEPGNVQPVANRTRVIPDIAIPFDKLAAVDAYLQVRIDEFQRERLYLRDVTLDADIEDGALELRDLSLHARSGFLRAYGKLEPGDGIGRLQLGLLTENLAFGTSESNRSLRGTANIKVSLEATGNDLRSLAGAATGVALFDIRGGAIPNNRMLQFFYGGVFEQILMTINPFIRSEDETTIECIVVPAQVTDGQLTTDPAAYVRTDKINMTVKPEINLDNERLEMSIRSTPRKALTISAAEIVNPYVKVIGTLAEPALAVDEKGALISGSAAVATMGLSFLAKAAWDRLSRSPNPCKSARQDASKALADRFPGIEPLEHLPVMPPRDD
jgi:uncharacterized protein involved in outer membrane biogenesis